MKYGPQRNWRLIASNKTMRLPIKDGRPRVNAKPYRPNICFQMKISIVNKKLTNVQSDKKNPLLST